jgi:exodeoxyribonuclease V beta subunit
VVFCLFSWRDSDIKRGHDEQVFFHDPAHGHKLVRDLGPDVAEEHRRQARQERLAENVRLLYVALTRAKHRCYFVWGGIKGAGTSAPAWLFHRPPAGDGPLLETLDAHFKSLTDEGMLEDLAPLGKRSAGALAVGDLPGPKEDRFKPRDGAGAKLECRPFRGRIQRDWVISSFTYFSAGLRAELPDRDAATAPPAESETPAEGMFGFPRGTKAGICLHEILQNLSFNAADEEVLKLVNQRLQAHGLAQAGNTEAAHQMLKRLLAFPLAPDRKDFTLSKIASSDRLNELEFHFPVQGVSPARLRELLGKLGWSSAVPAQFGRLAFDPIQGFLKGFIDLVFRFEDRFYLVDWKSNWLGNRVEDYGPAALAGEIRRRHYYFQYQLYTAALDRYLRLRLPGYRYEQHFGGVYYLFLRGIDPARPGFGIHRDRLEEPFVRRLNKLLTGTVGGKGRGHD